MKKIKRIGLKIRTKIGTMGLVLLLILMAGVLVPQTLAKPQYATALQTTYGSSLCINCHTDPSGGKSLTDYGSKFKSQQNYKSDPNGALQAIGAPPGTVTITDVATPTIATLSETPTVADTQIATPTTLETVNPVNTKSNEKEKEEANEKEEETSEKEETHTAPGFDIVITVGIVSTLYVLRRYKIGR